ncbi:TPA: aminotransferase class I/II-fold pyridoxal phosphate-dependent enzyme [Candidatus Galligastranaerophilus intestinigallinarum]|nr:aminotransferase class I/II-fold pyridoxal phosphate-dependent enzyme [Candidatus Galligastranaerophilus intestinigallinarum]
MKNETKCLHSGYTPVNAGPRVMPIYQSTTFRYNSTDEVGAVFNDPTKSHIYTRFTNPTVDVVEKKIADLEGGVAAMCTTSGQMASLMSILNLCNSGDSFISSSSIYGGTVNLFAVTLKKLGIECIFVDVDATEEEINSKIKPNTKAVFAETLTNPSLQVLDIEKFAKVAHKNKIPLIVDNTFPTPILCRPFEWGADIVIHSTSKYMDGHALQVGGVIVDSGKFDFTNGKFPEFTEPDESYHGTIYTRDYSFAPYIIKARMQLMRDFGAYPSGHSGFLLNLGLETLALRMERYCKNAMTMAEYFVSTGMFEEVRYPGLKGDKYYDLAQKYLPNGSSGVISLTVKGGKQAAAKFMDGLKMASNEVHVADIRTCVLHPATATHRQLTDEQLIACGINPGLVRFSVGLENVEDIINDVDNSLKNLR